MYSNVLIFACRHNILRTTHFGKCTLPSWKLFELYKCTIITKLEDYSKYAFEPRAHYHSSSSMRPITITRLSSSPSPDYLMPLIPMIVYPSNDFMKIIIHLQLVTARVRLHVVWMTHKPAEAQESLHDITQCYRIGHTGQASRPYFIHDVSVDFV